ncbi:MAG: inositol 2-dehydrogenase [Pseudomonadota bacterium]
MTLNIAMFGAGRIGRVHATALASDPRARLAAVHDVMTGAADALASEHGATVRSPEAIFADRSIDAILIASSTNTHAELIEAGVAAGKAVFCEKPIDLSLERALAVLGTVRAGDCPVMMGFNRRFDPNFAALKAAFDGGEIGKGELLAITSFDPGPPPLDYVKVSGGLFRDMMIHDLDICAWLFGMPAKVTATASCLVDPNIGVAGDVDTAVVTLRWPDGRIATIRNSRRATYGYDQRIELLGSEGMLEVGNVGENTVRKSSAPGVLSAKPLHFFLERYMEAYRSELSAFVSAVIDGAPVPATVQDGVNALALAEAATLSLADQSTIPMAPEMTGG